MSFRAGNQGAEMWPMCVRYGVAAITYIPLARTDLSKLPRGEPKELWSKLASAQIASLRRVVYDMAVGDTIYVKQGPKIISKGHVTGPYEFDSKFRIIDPNGVSWPHQVPVSWATDFPEISIKLGAEMSTVLRLSAERVQRLESQVDSKIDTEEKNAILEGEIFKKEMLFEAGIAHSSAPRKRIATIGARRAAFISRKPMGRLVNITLSLTMTNYFPVGRQKRRSMIFP
jgi:hypothetical protein